MSLDELRAEAKRFVVWNLARQGLSSGEIAAALDVPKSTVRRMLRRLVRERNRQRAVEVAYAAWCLNAMREIPPETLARRSRQAVQRVYVYSGRTGHPVDLAAVIDRDEARCHICGKPVEPIELAFDHVVPLVHGGEHTAENVRLSHA